MYSQPRERPRNNEPTCCYTMTHGFCKKSPQSKQNTSKNKSHGKKEPGKNNEDKRPGHEVRQIVKSIQSVSRYLPLVLTSVFAFEPGRKDCDTCNMDREAYKKIMRTLNMVDILASRAIEKEQTDMFEETETRREEEKKTEQQKEDKLSFGFEVFSEKSMPVHSLKCILIKLQNHLAYLIVQIGYVKTKRKENEPRYRQINMSVNEFQAIRFECTALTNKVITLLKGPEAANVRKQDVGVCVGCVKQDLTECNDRLESVLQAGANMVLVMRNDRPGQCCRRDYAHVHAQAHGQPIVLKYQQPFIKASERNKPAASIVPLPGSLFQSPHQEHSGDSEDDPYNDPHSDPRSSYQPSILRSSIPRDRAEEYPNVRKLSKAEPGEKMSPNDEFDDPHTNTVLSHDSHRKPSILRDSTPSSKKQISDAETVRNIGADELKDPRSDTLGTHGSRRRSSEPRNSTLADPRSHTLDTDPRSHTLDTQRSHLKNPEPSVSKLTDPYSGTISSHSKSVPSSTVMYFNKEEENPAVKTLPKAEPEMEGSSDDELHNLPQDPRSETLSSWKSYRISNDQSKPRTSMKTLSKAEPDIKVNTDDELSDLSHYPRSETLSSRSSNRKSNVKKQPRSSTKTLPKANPDTKENTDDEFSERSHDPRSGTLSSQKTNRKSNDPSNPRSSTKRLSKAAPDKKVHSDDEFSELSRDPHTETLNSRKSHRKSNDQSNPRRSTKTLTKAESVLSVNIYDVYNSADTLQTHSFHSKSPSSRGSTRKLSKTESNLNDSSGEYSTTTEYSDKTSNKDTNDGDDHDNERRHSKISHVSFKDSVTDASFDTSGSFPSYLQEGKKTADSDVTNKSSVEKSNVAPFMKPGNVPVYLVAMDSIIMTQHKMSHMSVKGSKQETYDPQPPDTAVVNAYKRFLDRPEYETKVIESAKNSDQNKPAKKKKPKTTKRPHKVINADHEKSNIENNKVKDLLDFFGRERLLKASTPAECCLQRNLEEEYGGTINIPLRPSLDSLPLGRNDLTFLAQQLGMNIDPNRFLLVVEEEPKDQECEWERKLADDGTGEDKTKWQRAMDVTASRARHSEQPFLPTISEEPSNCSFPCQKSKPDVVEVKTSYLPLMPSIPSMRITKEEKKQGLGKKNVPTIQKQRTTELRYFTVEFPLDGKNRRSKSLPKNFHTKGWSERESYPTGKACNESVLSLEQFHSCNSSISKLVSVASKLKESLKFKDSVEIGNPFHAVNEMIMLNAIYLDSSKDNDEFKNIWKAPIGTFSKLSLEDFEQKISECRLKKVENSSGSEHEIINTEQPQDELCKYNKHTSTRLEEQGKENKPLTTSGSDEKENNTPIFNTLNPFDERIPASKFYTVVNTNSGQKLKITNDVKRVIGEGDTKKNNFQDSSGTAQILQQNKSYTIFKGHKENDIVSIIQHLHPCQKTERKVNILKRPYDSCYSLNSTKVKNKKSFRNHVEVPFKRPKIETTIPPIQNREELHTNSNIRRTSMKHKISTWSKLRLDNVNVKNYIAQHKKNTTNTNFNEAFRNLSLKERKRKPFVLSYPSIEYRRFQCHVKLPEFKFVNLKPILSNLQSPIIVCRQQFKTKLVPLFQTCDETKTKSLYNFKYNTLNNTTLDQSILDDNFVAVQHIPESSEVIKLNCFDYTDISEINKDGFDNEDKYSTLIVVNSPKLTSDNKNDRPLLKNSKKSSNCSDSSSYKIFGTGALLCESSETRLLDANCNPLSLFDAQGRPLTDSSGCFLRDIDGRSLTIWDEVGTPVCDVNGGKIYDRLGRSLSDEDFDPTKPARTEMRILKTLMSPSGDPLRLYDRSSGTMLMDAGGRGLIRFGLNGQPCSDIAGGSLYDSEHNRIAP